MGRINDVSYILIEQGLQDFSTPIDRLTKNGFSLVETESHINVLRSLTGKHKHHIGRSHLGMAGGCEFEIQGREAGDRRCTILTNHKPPMVEAFAP